MSCQKINTFTNNTTTTTSRFMMAQAKTSPPRSVLTTESGSQTTKYPTHTSLPHPPGVLHEPEDEADRRRGIQELDAGVERADASGSVVCNHLGRLGLGGGGWGSISLINRLHHAAAMIRALSGRESAGELVYGQSGFSLALAGRGAVWIRTGHEQVFSTLLPSDEPRTPPTASSTACRAWNEFVGSGRIRGRQGRGRNIANANPHPFSLLSGRVLILLDIFIQMMGSFGGRVTSSRGFPSCG